MKKIGTISLTRLNNGAHFLFVTNICERAESDSQLKTKVSSLITAFRAAIESENESLKISRKSLLTDDIAEYDLLRGSLYASYKKAVNSYRGITDADKAEAAKVLWQHIKDYKIDPRMQLDQETGLLVNFINDLETSYSAQITLLALGAIVADLKSANETLRTRTLERTDTRTSLVNGAMRSARNASDAAYRAVVQMVNALAVVEGDTNYASFIDYVNTEIIQYKRQAIGQKADAPTADDTSGDDTSSGSSSEDVPGDL